MKPHRTLSLALLTGLLLSACGTGQPPVALDKTAPTVALVIDPATLTAAGTATFSAAASDNVGVTKVEFYDGDRLIDTDTEAPFQATASYTRADNGKHTIRAVAVDAAGNRGEGTATLTVDIPAPPIKDTEAPEVSLKATPETVSTSGNITLTATASDNVGVTRVMFYRGDALISEDSTAPYEVVTAVTAADNGTVTYRAVAVDAAGNTSEARTSVTVNIDAAKPTLNVTVIRNSSTSYTVNAVATDDQGVTKVEFYDNEKLISTDTEAPYSTSLAYTAADNGAHTVTVKAYDAQGNVTTSSQTFTVNVDTLKPAVSITATPDTLDRSGSVTVTATALDDMGVTRVEFYDNGRLVATDTAAPYTVTRSYTAADNGTHTLMARAYDEQGNTSEASTTVTVNADAVNPTVSLTAQPNPLNLPGTVTFTADASDDRGVTRVEFYDNGVLIGTDVEAPYTASKAYTYVDNGLHTVTVKAYDEQGNMGESSTALTVAITDANEPNDSLAAAQPLSINMPLNGTIAGQNRDFDYFKFDAAAGDMLKLTVKSVSVDPSSTLDPYVMILMPDGKTVLEKDDDSGAGLESEIRFNVPQTGTYYVVVTSFDIHDDVQATDDRASNTYQIALTRR